MGIGILFESKEWSSYKLHSEIEALGIDCVLIDLQNDIDLESLRGFDLIVSRVFASSVFRGHEKSLVQMEKIIAFLKDNEIPMVNTYEAHDYEISKALSTKVLKEHDIGVPEVYGVFFPSDAIDVALDQDVTDRIKYPCIAKPDCGGRSNATFILNSKDELIESMGFAQKVKYIIQEYIYPIYGYLTRIEIIGGQCKLILKRSVTENGLSSYNLGSKYKNYSDCPKEIKETAVKVMDILSIETGSMDIIENEKGFYVIDVNSVSNVSEDNTEMFQFDLMKETAAYIGKKYRSL